MSKPVNPADLHDVMRDMARREAEKAAGMRQQQSPPVSSISRDNPFLKLEERITKLEARVAELEKKAHAD